MLDTVLDAITSRGLLENGDRCIIAVSGGADSTGLMYALTELNKSIGASYKVVHVHHGLRGKEADRDADFVEELCNRMNIPCTVIKVNVRDYATKHKMSEEEAARYLRYEALEKEAERWESEEDGKPVKIAVAHNRQDNAETILMQFARGSGLKGLSGMSYERDRIIRPLLDVNRDDIEDYLSGLGATWIHDSTNDEDEYTRNRIRHSVLPDIITYVNSGAVDNITRAAKLFGKADEYLKKTAAKELEACIKTEQGGYSVDAKAFAKQDEIVRTYMVRLLIAKVCRTMKDITSKHIEDVANLLDFETGKRIDLPYGLVAIKDYDRIRLIKKNKEAPANEGRFYFRAFAYEGQDIPEGEYIKWFDYDSIYDLMDVRTRKAGDYIVLKGVGRKSLNSYMSDMKIPADMRESVNVIAVGSEIMWVVGYRIGETFKINNTTKTILEIEYRKGE